MSISLGGLFRFDEKDLLECLEQKISNANVDPDELAMVLVEGLTRCDLSQQPTEATRAARTYLASDSFKHNSDMKDAVSIAFIAKYRSPVPALTSSERLSGAHLLALRIQETLIEEATQLLATCPPHHPMEDFVNRGREGFEHLTGRVQTAWVKAAETLAKPNASDALKMTLALIIEKALESQDPAVQQKAASALPKAITGLGDFSGLLVPAFSNALVAKDGAVRNIAQAAALEIIPVAPVLFLKALRDKLCKMKLPLPEIQTPLNKKIKASPSAAFPRGGGVDGSGIRRAPIYKKTALTL